MHITFIEMRELKNKFAKFLSYLYHDLKLEMDNISSSLIHSPLLDMLENNEIDEFMAMPNEKMARELFPSIQIEPVSNDDTGPVYWSGIQYINIFLNYRIPLRTLFVLCPLKEMVKKYPIYHEMNEIELCRAFMNNEYKNISILKYLRTLKGVNVRQLSLLTDVPEPTIKYLEETNQNLYNSSLKIIEPIIKALNIDYTFLKRKSSYVPANYSLLKSDEFVVLLSIVIGQYFLKVPSPNLSVKFFKHYDDDAGDAFLILEDSPHVIYENKTKYIDDSVFMKMVDKTIDVFLERELVNTLVF